MRTAVVGAGIAGLACTRALVEEGHEVTVYEAAAHPSGRIATLRTNGVSDQSGIVADHGARYFSARFERFLHEVESWIDRGEAARWQPRTVAINDAGVPEAQIERLMRFVGVPTMDAPLRALATGLESRAEFRYATPVRTIHHASGDWVVTDDSGRREHFDAVATAVPAPGAVQLLTEVAHLHTAAARVPMAPCWSLALRFAERLPLDYDAARVNLGARHEHAGVLAWADRESSKPGRSEDEVWVLQSSDQFAREHIGSDESEISTVMLDAFFAATGIDRIDPAAHHARLWKAALPVAPLCDGCLYDEQLRIGACGDWCMGARVEGAYLSGLAMADRLNGRHRDSLATYSLAHHSA